MDFSSSNEYLIIISSFLEKFNINIYNSPKNELSTLYLPIYGITLWRVFPKQKMNMWLYRQSLSSCYRKETKPNLSFLSPVSALLLWYVGIIVYISILLSQTSFKFCVCKLIMVLLSIYRTAFVKIEHVWNCCTPMVRGSINDRIIWFLLSYAGFNIQQLQTVVLIFCTPFPMNSMGIIFVLEIQ